MAHIDIPAGDEVERLRMWQMVPAMAEGIDAMRQAVYSDETKLSIRERDVARMRIAQINDCDI
jgi:alkylhydroperoxidase family enzyme